MDRDPESGGNLFRREPEAEKLDDLRLAKIERRHSRPPCKAAITGEGNVLRASQRARVGRVSVFVSFQQGCPHASAT
jgi:hypothetical protein